MACSDVAISFPESLLSFEAPALESGSLARLSLPGQTRVDATCRAWASLLGRGHSPLGRAMPSPSWALGHCWSDASREEGGPGQSRVGAPGGLQLHRGISDIGPSQGAGSDRMRGRLPAPRSQGPLAGSEREPPQPGLPGACPLWRGCWENLLGKLPCVSPLRLGPAAQAAKCGEGQELLTGSDICLRSCQRAVCFLNRDVLQEQGCVCGGDSKPWLRPGLPDPPLC